MRILIVTCLCVYCSSVLAQDPEFRQCGRQAGKYKPAAAGAGQAADQDHRVHMFDAEQNIYADRVQFFEEENKAVATGNVLMRDPDLDMTATRVDYWPDKKTAKAENVRYWYHPRHGSGVAQVAERMSEDIFTLKNATYSTCDFEDRAWELSSKNVILDRKKGVGRGRHVVAKFKNVPFFYSPWLSFPINKERKTGFLAPVFGRSSSSGGEIETPFYWNIAPHRDALLRPRYLTKRGLQLGARLRYLNAHNFGHANVQFLDDKKFADQRYLVNLIHNHRFSPRLNANLVYNNASDDDYFKDLGNTIGLASSRQLERRADLTYSGTHSGANWYGLLRLQQFQIADSNSSSSKDPFKRLPQIYLQNSFALPAGLTFFSSAEWVAFDHDDRVDGNRTHLQATLSRPWQAPGYFITPSLRWLHTAYDLASSNRKNNPRRTLPGFALDSGLVFERLLPAFRLRHTLEPRLYYLYTPYRRQDDIPLFDTSQYEFGYNQLFRNDRFSGHDRIADANQVTAALDTRLVNTETGREMLRASLGQIFFFADRRVALTSAKKDGRAVSNLVGELSISPSERWKAIAGAIWDRQKNEFFRTNVNLQYRGHNNFIFNAGHRFRRMDFSQSDISFIYPFSDQWRAVGRWNYDLRKKRSLDLLAGIEYDTCCWKLRIAARRFLKDAERNVRRGAETYSNSIEFQLTLKGLTSLGSPISEQLQRNIRGYENQNTFVY